MEEFVQKNINSPMIPERDENGTEFTDVRFLVNEVLSENWNNVSNYLSEWQIQELVNEGLHKTAVECLVHHWLITQPKLEEGRKIV